MVEESSKPLFAIAHQGLNYVDTCAGFSCPVISIHKELFHNDKIGTEHLTFAIAHELALLKFRGDRQFTQISQSQRLEADKKALEVVGNRKIAVEFIQAQSMFHSRFNHPKSSVKPDFFNWPKEAFTAHSYSSLGNLFFEARLKGLKVLNLDFKDVSILNIEPFTIDVNKLTSYHFFPDFPQHGNKHKKLEYLKHHIADLKKEFLSFVLCQIASQRVKQFCALVQGSSFDFPMKNDLVRALHKSRVHSFGYIYKSIVGIAPNEYYDGHVIALGYFHDMHQAMRKFIDNCNFNKPYSDVNSAAKRILELLPLIKPHIQNYQKNEMVRSNHVDTHDGLLPDEFDVESDIGSLIDWPRVNNLDTVIPYLKTDTEGHIWKVLWLMGYHYDKRLIHFIPKPFLQSILNGANGYEYHQQGVEYLPMVKVSFEYSFPTSAQSAIHEYFLQSLQYDTSMLQGDFMAEFEIFWQANRSHLIYENSPHHEHLTSILLDEFQKLIDGDMLQQAFVLNFYEDSTGPFREIATNTTFSKQNPYIQFLLKNKQTFSPFRIEAIVTHISFVSVQDKHDVVMETFGFNERYQDDLSKILAYINYSMSGKLRHGIVDSYWKAFFDKHGELDFNQHTMRIIDFLKSNSSYSKGFIHHLRFDINEIEQLPLYDCIILYRVLDRDFGFVEKNIRDVLTNKIRVELEALKDLDQKIDFLEQLIFIKASPSEFVLVDKIFINYLNQLLGETYAKKYGQDDGSKAYYQKVKDLLNRIYQNASKQDTIKIFDHFSQNIISQGLVSQCMGQLIEPEKHDHYFSQSMQYYAGLTSILSKFGENDSDKQAVMMFISSPLTDSSLDNFAQFIMTHRNRRDIAKRLRLNSQDLKKDEVIFSSRCVYQQFWDLPINHRAIALDSLIITESQEMTDEAMFKAYQFGFDFIVNKLFPNVTTNEREAFALALLTSYLETADNFERQFLLAGLFVTSNESSGKQETVGKKFALLCEHMGPAYVKLAQAIHSHPDTPEDIKDDLAHVKGRANPPKRWQLWHLLKKTLPSEVYSKISFVGKLLGSASYNLALACTYDGNPDRVLTLLRENAARDAEKGFIHLNKAINHCQHPTIMASKQTFTFMIDEAATLSAWEINNDVSNIQYNHAKSLYQGVTIDVQNDKVHFTPCDNIANGAGFKILSRVPGVEYNELTDVTLKKVIAKAVVKKELHILLSGGVFDSDRHGSQYRVTFNGRDIHLGLYDFGEMSLTHLTQDELLTYAALLRELPKTIKENKSISDLFQKHIQKAISENHSYRHLMRINKAILALNDFKMYLNNDDLLKIVYSIQSNIHPLLKKALQSGYTQSSSYVELGMTFFNSLKRTVSEYINGSDGSYNDKRSKL